MATVSQRSRFRYKSFKGRPTDNPEKWLEEFESTATANGESRIKLTLLPRVLKGEARPWFWLLSPTLMWDQFRDAFLKEFRPIGIASRALKKMGHLQMGKDDSLQRFLQRFHKVTNKIRPRPHEALLRNWFIAALPQKMAFAMLEKRTTML